MRGWTIVDDDQKAPTLRDGLRVVGRGIRDEPGIFAVAVAGSFVYGVGTAGTGWLVGRLTNRIVAPAFARGSISTRELATLGGLMAGAAVLTAVGVVVRRAAAGMTIYRLQARYRRAVTQQYLRLPLSWHHRHPAGELLSTAASDVEATWQVFAPLPMSLGVAVMLVVAAAAMIAADPVLAAVGLLVLPALLAANSVYQRRMSPLVMRAQQLRGEVSAVAHESFDGAQTVKALGREAAETERFADRARALRDANVAAGRLRGLFDPVIEGLPTLGTLAVLVVGAGRVATGRTAPGDVVQVAYVLALVSFPVRSLGWVLGELPRTVVGWRRVGAVLAAQGSMAYGSARLPELGRPAALAVHDAGYAYRTLAPDGREEDVEVLHGVRFEVAPGRTVALVGPTGSGKSTVASLLVRLIDPRHGTVSIDGVDLRTLRPGEVASVAALVPQGTFIFEDTVRDNVTLGAELPDRLVWQALETAGVDQVVRRLGGGVASGLDARLGERGTTLSGGQRQRVALARALVRDPRLLVLDDATSAVDPRVEAQILARLREQEVTVVVVAYRLATISLADEVIYLEHGRVVGQGTHEQLMQRVPGYRSLVTAYQRDAEERARVDEEAS